MTLKVAEVIEDDPEYQYVKKYWSEEFCKELTGGGNISKDKMVEIQNNPKYQHVKKYWSDEFLKKLTGDVDISRDKIVDVKFNFKTITILYNS